MIGLPTVYHRPIPLPEVVYPIYHIQRYAHHPGIGLKLFSQRLDVHISRYVVKSRLHLTVLPG